MGFVDLRACLQSLVKDFLARAVQVLGNLHRRVLVVFFVLIGPRRAYALTGWGARAIYWLLPPVRVCSEAQCRAALPDRSDREICDIARESFVHRARNMTDLLLASRTLHADNFARFGGRIDEPWLGQLLEGKARKVPTIFVTAYYGPFDMLPIFLGYNGIDAAAVYLPHENAGFDRFRRTIRGQSGCELVAVDQAAKRFNEILGKGGMIAVLADHPDEKHGLPVTLLGVEALVSRSVGLLAWRHEANVVVAAIRRLDNTFRFKLIMADVIYAHESRKQPDPVEYVTRRYVRAIEQVILEDPTQYLWAYARWGETHADRVTTDRLKMIQRKDPAPSPEKF